jgi:esterase/lipase
MNDTVLLFHGIARTKKSMAKLAGFLSGHGYRVVNVGYPSTKFSISDLIEYQPWIVKLFASTNDFNLS